MSEKLLAVQKRLDEMRYAHQVDGADIQFMFRVLLEWAAEVEKKMNEVITKVNFNSSGPL